MSLFHCPIKLVVPCLLVGGQLIRSETVICYTSFDVFTALQTLVSTVLGHTHTLQEFNSVCFELPKFEHVTKRYALHCKWAICLENLENTSAVKNKWLGYKQITDVGCRSLAIPLFHMWQTLSPWYLHMRRVSPSLFSCTRWVFYWRKCCLPNQFCSSL